MKRLKYYTVYLKKTDEIIASGIAIDCAVQMKKSLNGFLSMVSKNRKGIQNKYSIISETVFCDDEGNIEECED